MARKYLDVKEFVEIGYLQEINRKFLHPLGLALEVTYTSDGTAELSGVWDSRDDPAGVYFAEGVLRRDKTLRVEEEQGRRVSARQNALGYVIQPV